MGKRMKKDRWKKHIKGRRTKEEATVHARKISWIYTLDMLGENNI